MKQMIGSWAFLIGVILAVIFGVISMNQTVAVILFVLGLIIGLLNITTKETQPFLLAGAVLVIVSSLAVEVPSAVSWIGGIFNALNMLFVPATIIVALKSVFHMARK